MLSDQVTLELSPEPILSAAEDYHGSMVDLDRRLVVRPEAFARGRRALVRQMGQLGLETGDRVVMAVGNGPLFPATLAAILTRGGSPLLLHAETPPAELKRTAMHYGARFILCDGRTEEDLTPMVKTVDLLDAGDWAQALWGTVDDREAAFHRDYEATAAVPLHPTSGTTGVPKVAARPGPCAVAEGLHYIEAIGIDASDVILAVAPMSHAYAYGHGVIVPLLSGASCVAMRRFNVKLVHQAVQEYKITMLPAVPAMLDMLIFGAGDRLRQFVRHVFTAGSPLAERTARNFHRASGLAVRPLLGTTETGVVALTQPDDLGKYGGCVGHLFPEVEVEILKSHARSQPLDQIGTVLDLEQVRRIQQEVMEVHVDDGILEYMVEIVHTTRHDNRLQLGISTRGTLMLSRAAQARAYYENRQYVIPDDVLWCAPHVLPHRMILTAKTRYSGTTTRQIVSDIVSRIKVPV